MAGPAQVIGEVYRRNAGGYGDKPAFIMPDGRARSFAVLQERVCRLCNALLAHGLKPGDRVGILSRNRIEYVEGYGVSAAGLKWMALASLTPAAWPAKALPSPLAFCSKSWKPDAKTGGGRAATPNVSTSASSRKEVRLTGMRYVS